MLPKFEITLKPEAEFDFIEIRNWYENVSAGLGTKFFENYIATLKKIERNPHFCFNVGHGYRRASIQAFPYNVFFQIEGNIIVVFGILHQHRDPEEWQKRSE